MKSKTCLLRMVITAIKSEFNLKKPKRTMTSKVMKYNCECCGYARQNKSNFQRHTKTKKHQRNNGLCVENLHEHYSTSDDCQDAEYFKDECETQLCVG